MDYTNITRLGVNVNSEFYFTNLYAIMLILFVYLFLRLFIFAVYFIARLNEIATNVSDGIDIIYYDMNVDISYI